MPINVLVLDDSFTHADTVAGAAGTNTGVPTTPAVGAANGWYDRFGSVFSISGNALKAHLAAGADNTKAYLYRPIGEALATSRVVLRPDNINFPSNNWNIVLGYVLSANASYQLALNFAASTAYVACYDAGAFVSNQTPIAWSIPYDAAHVYEIDASLEGANPTVLTVTVNDVTAGAVFWTNSGTPWSNSRASLQVPRVFALSVAGTDNSKYLRIQGYSDVGAALTSGVATVSGNTTTTISLSATAASGGTGPYTYQWYRSPVSVFTPGAGTLISGATGLALSADNPGAIGENPVYYKIRSTDSAGTPAVVDSTSTIAFLRLPPVRVLSIGDSIAKIYDTFPSPPAFPAALAAMLPNRTVTVLDHGVSGSKSGDWVGGSANLNAAIADADGPPTHIHYYISVNDAQAAVLTSQATFKANLQNTIAALQTAFPGVPITISLSWGVGPQEGANWDDHANDAIATYNTAIGQVVNGSTVRWGSRRAAQGFSLIQNASYTPDGIHPASPGGVTLLGYWLAADFVASNGLAGTYAVGPGEGGSSRPIGGGLVGVRL